MANPWLDAYRASPTYGQKVMPVASPTVSVGPVGAAKPKGNTLLSLIPSVLAAGASFVPGVGTAAAAGLGGAGELLRQRMAGENLDLKKAGIEAGLSAIPGGLGLAAKGVKAANAVKIGAKAVEGAEAVTGAARASRAVPTLADALGEVSAKTSMAGKLEARANYALEQQYGTIARPISRANDLPGTVAKLKQIGITNPQDAERVAAGITGSHGILTKAVTKAAGSAGRVSTDGLDRIAKDAVENHGLVDTDAKSTLAIVKGKLRQLQGGANPTDVNGTAHPSDALGVMKDLEKKIADLSGKGGNYKLTDPTRQDKAKVLQAVHDEIEDRLYRTAGGNRNISKALTPEVREQLVALHPGNAQWAKHVDNTIMKSTDLGAIRAAQKPFVNISKIIEEGSLNSPTMGGRVGNSITQGGLIQGAVGHALASDTAKRAEAAALSAAANGGSTVGKIAASKPVKFGKALAGQGAVRGGAALLTAGGGQGDASQLPAGVDPALTDPTAAATPDASQTPSISAEQLQQMAMDDIQKTGGKNLAQIKTLYDLFGPGSVDTKADKPLSSTAAETVGNTQSGLDALGQLQGDIAKDPNVANKDLVAHLAGNFGRRIAGTQDYASARSEIIDVLARLRTGAAISKQEEAQYQQMLPTAGDSPEVVQQKIDRYKTLFQGIATSVQGGQ